MAIQKFEEIIAWQKAQDLAVRIYKEFINCKDYAFKDQVTKAAVSISNNIAEGFDRGSNAEFSRFLYYSLGSNSEVRSMLYLGEKLEFLSNEVVIELHELSNEISRMLYGLIKSMKK